MRSYLYKKLQSLLIQKEQEQKNQEKFYDWDHVARPSQREPLGQWRIWLILAGRGFGKTRTGAQTIRKWVMDGHYRRLCLLGCSFDEVRRVMIEGESGLLSISPPGELHYQRAKQEILWKNGAKAWAMSAQNPDLLRGPQFDAAWIDELTKFPCPKAVWDQLMFTLRLGNQPKIIITTTPKPCALLNSILERKDVVVTRGTTYENTHLSRAYLDNIESSYAGTRLASQEIEGNIVTQQGWLQEGCFQYACAPDTLTHIVVAIDPAVHHDLHHAETGIIVAARDSQGYAYILEDLSLRASPKVWMETALQAYKKYKAHLLVAEVNNGGQLIESLLHTMDTTVRYKAVHALKDKKTRAQPALHLYEQRRVFHVRPFMKLESQLLGDQKSGNDRLDALVWALDALFQSQSAAPRLSWV